MKRTELNIDFQDCSSCADNIQKALELLPGVEFAQVEFERRHAVVEYDEARIQPERIVEMVGKAGYHAEHAPA